MDKKKSKTCRWRYASTGGYRTTCNRYFFFDGWEVDTFAYRFCPGCGRKIEVKE